MQRNRNRARQSAILLLAAAALSLVSLAVFACTGPAGDDGDGDADMPSAPVPADGADRTPADGSGVASAGTETPGVAPSPELAVSTGVEVEDPVAFQETYGFSAAYLMDVQELREHITELAEVTSAPLASGIVGVPAKVDADYQVIDIRASAFFATGFIPGSVNIPGGKQFEYRLREVDLDKHIVLISAYEYRDVAGVIGILSAAGVPDERIHVLWGGLQAWPDAGYTLNIDRGRRCTGQRWVDPEGAIFADEAAAERML